MMNHLVHLQTFQTRLIVHLRVNYYSQLCIVALEMLHGPFRVLVLQFEQTIDCCVTFDH